MKVVKGRRRGERKRKLEEEEEGGENINSKRGKRSQRK